MIRPAALAHGPLVTEELGEPESEATEWRILLAADRPVVRRVHEARIDHLSGLLGARTLRAQPLGVLLAP